jgi:uncharacterized protein
MHVDPLGAAVRAVRLPLFPLKTVLFPGGRLALRLFEQRYLAMAKTCLSGDAPFGVCLITQGEEVALPGAGAAPAFAAIGTLATIRSWDMPQLGILNVTAEGATRFAVRSHELLPDGLVVADVTPISPDPPKWLADCHRPLAELLHRLAARIDSPLFPEEHAFDDASWVGFRLAELLPLHVADKQHLLELADAEERLAALHRYVGERGLV